MTDNNTTLSSITNETQTHSTTNVVTSYILDEANTITDKADNKIQNSREGFCAYIFPKTSKHCSFLAYSSDSKYCGKHMRLGTANDQQALGIIRCKNYIRGCTTILSKDYTKKRCEKCLEQCRQKDNAGRKRRKDVQKRERESGATTLTCIICKISKDVSVFVTKTGQPSEKCGDCLEKQRIVDENRPLRDRTEWSKEYHSRPDVLKRKRQWKIDNKDKAFGYYRKYRMKLIEEDPIAYRKRAAENAAKWKANNPENLEANRKRRRVSGAEKISYYKSSAAQKGISMNLTAQEMLDMFCLPCWYCGYLPTEGTNGIDRLDSDGPYSDKNTRACCTLCNYSKGGMSLEQFIAQTYRIAVFSGDFPDIDSELKDVPYFSLSGCDSFTKFCNQASKRKKECNLTKEQFDFFRSENCYLCGNRPSGGCGIDRVDNDIGYIYDNCQSCCNTCNMMKRDEDLEDFIQRCINICITFSGMTIDEIQEISPSEKTNRLQKRTTVGVTLSKDVKSDIIWRERAKLKDWANISARVDAGTGSDEDIALIEKLTKNIEIALENEISQQKKSKLGDKLLDIFNMKNK